MRIQNKNQTKTSSRQITPSTTLFADIIAGSILAHTPHTLLSESVPEMQMFPNEYNAKSLQWRRTTWPN